MAFELEKIGVYRIIPVKNLEFNLRDGLYSKNSQKTDAQYVSIGSKDVIARRDTVRVKCYPETFVNDYVPFYFSVRTPMLYNIITGHGVTPYPQSNVIYLCYKLIDLATDDFQWCYTNGNASVAITKFYNILTGIETNIDWHSIETTDFRDDNADGDEDRIRKKHSEFLVKDHVPTNHLKGIVVLNDNIKDNVNSTIKKLNLEIKVKVNPNDKFYF